MNKIYLIIIALSVLSLQACLKGRDMVLDPVAVPATVEFGNVAGLGSAPTDSFRLYSVNYEISPSAILELPLNYTGKNTASKDITVTVAVDAALLSSYNTVKSTNVTLLPSTTYSLPLTAVIKKGTRTILLPIDFKVDQISPTGSFALPLQISDASGEIISKNFGRIIISVTPKNIYDGSYKVVSGEVIRYTNPTTPANDALSGSMAGNPNVTLTTVGAYTVELGNMRWAGGTSGIGGINNLRATVDPATNLVTMAAIGNATLANIPGAINKYDPATKTFTLNFDWNQTSTKREIKNLVLSYTGSR
ncbi:MAG: DUF1735 domain-containing protein [Niabella sp.]